MGSKGGIFLCCFAVFCQFIPVPDQISGTLLLAHLLLEIVTQNKEHLQVGLVSLIDHVMAIILPHLAGLALEGPVKDQYQSGLKEQVLTWGVFSFAIGGLFETQWWWFVNMQSARVWNSLILQPIKSWEKPRTTWHGLHDFSCLVQVAHFPILGMGCFSLWGWIGSLRLQYVYTWLVQTILNGSALKIGLDRPSVFMRLFWTIPEWVQNWTCWFADPVSVLDLYQTGSKLFQVNTWIG